MSKKSRIKINANLIFLPFLFLLFFLIILYPEKIICYPNYVDWTTIVSLFGLLMITTGIKESSFMRSIAKEHLKKIGDERKLALFFIFLTSALAMILTNDIALFIVVPLTLSFQEFLRNDIKKIIIFEAIAANVGSALTPIGNPQNLFLWYKWNISFINFIIKMIPLFLILFLILIVFSRIVFPADKLLLKPQRDNIKTNKKLLFFSVAILSGYILSIVLGNHYTVIIVFIFYLIFYREVLKKLDYALIMLFIIIFIDFHLIGEMSIISNFIGKFNFKNPAMVFMSSIFLSQLISNVPSGIFMSQFSHNWFAITYGVNVGGNGIVIASFANIIALRFLNEKKAYLEFHKYSLLYSAITGMIIYVLFFL